MTNKKNTTPPDNWDVFFTIFLPVSLTVGWVVTVLAWIAEMNK